jgi:hypothetical protein
MLTLEEKQSLAKRISEDLVLKFIDNELRKAYCNAEILSYALNDQDQLVPVFSPSDQKTIDWFNQRRERHLWAVYGDAAKELGF